MDQVKVKQAVLDAAGGTLEGKMVLFTVTQLSTGAQFLGSTEGVERRFYALRSTLRSGTCNNPRLQEAWNKTGEGDFEFRVVDAKDSKAEAKVAERALMEQLKPQFNQAVSGRRGGKGSKLIQAD